MKTAAPQARKRKDGQESLPAAAAVPTTIFSLGKLCEVVHEGQGVLQKKGGTVGFLVVREL